MARMDLAARQRCRLATEAAGAEDVVDRSPPGENILASHRSTHRHGSLDDQYRIQPVAIPLSPGRQLGSGLQNRGERQQTLSIPTASAQAPLNPAVQALCQVHSTGTDSNPQVWPASLPPGARWLPYSSEPARHPYTLQPPASTPAATIPPPRPRWPAYYWRRLLVVSAGAALVGVGGGMLVGVLAGIR